MYVAETEGIRIRVVPTFVPERSNAMVQQWLWMYRVAITNQSTEPVRLMTRHWIITDAHGQVEEVEGVGVVGETPLILPGNTHTYASFCPLRTPFGSMHGTYGMVKEDGERFKAEVPQFNLVAPDAVN